MSSIENFVQRKIAILNQETSVRDAARAMRDGHQPAVLAVDDQGQLCGIVTDRDFTTKIVAELGSNEIPLSRVMSRDPVTIDDDARVMDALEKMEHHGVRRLVVLTGDRVAGLVTLDDFISGGAAEGGCVSRIIRGQMRRRMSLDHLAEGVEQRSGFTGDPHAEQTLAVFHKKIAEYADLTLDVVPELAYFLIGAFLRRVTYLTGLHLIAQLPRLLQESLLKLPSGPDRDIGARAIVEEMVFRFSFTESYAWSVLRHFCLALEEIVGRATIDHLRSQLPKDLRSLFGYGAVSEEEQSVATLMPDEGDRRRKSRMELTSTAFNGGQSIPIEFTGEGADRSPELRWSGAPEATKEFAVICEDVDAPGRRPWVHWVAYNISASVGVLPQGMPAIGVVDLPVRLRQGKNTSGVTGYQGPMPPKGHGFHRYFFKLYALDKEIVLHAGATKDELVREMAGHVLAEAVLVGRYRRIAREQAA